MIPGMILANTRRSRSRVLFLAVVIALGASAFLVTQAIAERVQDVTQRELLEHASFLRLDVQPSPDGTAPDLIESVLAEIRQLEGVESVAPVLRETVVLEGSPVGMMASNIVPGEVPPLVQAVRDQVLPLAENEILLPSRMDGAPTPHAPGETVVVEYTVRTGPASGEGRQDELTVVGLFDDSFQPQGLNVAYVADTKVRSWLEFRQGLEPGQLGTEVGYDAIVVIAIESALVPAVASELRGRGYSVTDLQARLAQVPGVVGLVQIAGWLMLGMVAVLTLVAASSTVGVYVRQRRPEVGLLKAVGYRNRDVLSVLLGEAAVIGIVAAALAVILGIALSIGATAILAQIEGVSEALGGAVLLPSALACLVQGATVVAAATAGAVVPAAQAARMEPALALREP